jgi:hypothetical protein
LSGKVTRSSIHVGRSPSSIVGSKRRAISGISVALTRLRNALTRSWSGLREDPSGLTRPISAVVGGAQRGAPGGRDLVAVAAFPRVVGLEVVAREDRVLVVDLVKIDGEFIVDLAGDRTNQLVVRAVGEMARELGKRTVAEFVGDERTVSMLRQYGIDYLQGYHLGRPVPLEEAGLVETGARGPAYA